MSAILQGRQQNIEGKRALPGDAAQEQALEELRLRQRECMLAYRQYVLMELFGGREQYLMAPAAEVQRMWLVHQAKVQAENEQQERAASEARSS